MARAVSGSTFAQSTVQTALPKPSDSCLSKKTTSKYSHHVKLNFVCHCSYFDFDVTTLFCCDKAIRITECLRRHPNPCSSCSHPGAFFVILLQYYCCKKNDSEVDVASMAGPDPLAHFPCNACNALAMDGTAITPVSLDQLDSGSHHCPSCSPYTLRSGLTDDMRNGGERLGFHTYYENPSVSLPLSVHPQSSSPLSYCSPSDTFPPPPRSYSTDVWPLLHCTGTHTHTPTASSTCPFVWD